MKRIAAEKPKLIMLDDDFRLMFRDGVGCGCELHMVEFAKKSGENLTREELAVVISEDSERGEYYRKKFVETQHDALVGAMKYMREGIDEADVTLQGAYCTTGDDCEFAEELAQIFCGEGNPTIVRINNGAYHPQGGAHYFTAPLVKVAKQMLHMRGKVDIFLAETDTCPQNRYSTGAQFIHSHFSGTILEGTEGAKHWITKLDNFEPESGVAYRKILSRNSGFYEELHRISAAIEPIGCNLILPRARNYYFQKEKLGNGA